jgi:hypothetical protein
MKKWAFAVIGIFMMTGVSFADPKAVPPGQIKKAIRGGGYELVERAFQLNGGIGVSLIKPAGFVAADLYPEYYIIKGLSIGFDFVAVPVMENEEWSIFIDFVNIKYTWIPRTFPRLQPYLRMGWGIDIYSVETQSYSVETQFHKKETEIAFDWVWGSGLTYWITDSIGVGTDMVSHVTSDGTLFTWIYGIRWKIGF